MYTRKDYMSATLEERKDNKAHRRYYSQFVTQDVKQRVLRCISLKRLRASRNKHLNDIPLHRWDSLFVGRCPANVNRKMREAGDWPSPAGLVCLAKEAARQLMEENPMDDSPECHKGCEDPTCPYTH